MDEGKLDGLLDGLTVRNTASIDLESRVWTVIAQRDQEYRSGGFASRGLNWRLASCAVAIAAGVGFVTATIAPVANARPVQAIDSWTSAQSPLAPSDLLGG